MSAPISESPKTLPPENLAETFFHKLSQPIAAMYASLELGLMTDDSKQLKAAIESGLTQLERLRWLFQAAREFFATDFCSGAVNVSVRECMEAAISDSKPLAESKQITFSMIAKEDARVLADSSYLRDALENLLSRSIRNSERGGEIKLRLSNHDKMARIEISDDSRFDATSADNAFEPFPPGAQIGPSQPGNLDLALSQQIIHAFHGEVKLRATAEATSCFEITLPRHNSPVL